MGDFYSEPTGRVSNQFISIEYLTQGGPHIPRVSLTGTNENLFAETPGFDLETTYGIYHFRGGHRFCHAPEYVPRTYIPDNDGLSLEMMPDGVDLIGHIESGSGVQKRISLRLSADKPEVTVKHSLFNHNRWPIETAPWGISMMPLGGTAFLPTQAPDDPHAPNRFISIFSYSKWTDPRLTILDDFLVIDGKASKPALKIGYFNHCGWMAYLNKNVLFIKQFIPYSGHPHPDKNVNTEMYIEDKCMELESLAPLVTLQPGESVEHIETWLVIEDFSAKASLEETAKLIENLVPGK
jgi:hypothetical protein